MCRRLFQFLFGFFAIIFLTLGSFVIVARQKALDPNTYNDAFNKNNLFDALTSTSVVNSLLTSSNANIDPTVVALIPTITQDPSFKALIKNIVEQNLTNVLSYLNQSSQLPLLYFPKTDLLNLADNINSKISGSNITNDEINSTLNSALPDIDGNAPAANVITDQNAKTNFLNSLQSARDSLNLIQIIGIGLLALGIIFLILTMLTSSFRHFNFIKAGLDALILVGLLLSIIGGLLVATENLFTTGINSIVTNSINSSNINMTDAVLATTISHTIGDILHSIFFPILETGLIIFILSFALRIVMMIFRERHHKKEAVETTNNWMKEAEQKKTE